jgi:hypothetical protein
LLDIPPRNGRDARGPLERRTPDIVFRGERPLTQSFYRFVRISWIFFVEENQPESPEEVMLSRH